MGKSHWKGIAEDYLGRIERGELKPGDKIGSESEIAEEFGVSRPTAHRALHELQRLGHVNRQRRWGTVVAEKPSTRTGRVALIFDRFAPEYDFPRADLLRGIQEGLGDEFGMMLLDSKDDPDREAALLKKMRDEADGIICTPIVSARNTPLMRRMIADGVPIVFLDRVPEDLVVNAVVSDNEEAMSRVLHELSTRGHKKIGFFAFNKTNFSTIRERFHAYEAAMNERGVLEADRPVRWFARELETNMGLLFQSVYDALFTLMHEEEPTTAIFCTQDCFAAAVLDAADRLKIAVPEGLEIATFNDWPPMMLRKPWATHRVVQQTHSIGCHAAERLVQLIAREGGASRVIRVPAELFIADAGLLKSGV